MADGGSARFMDQAAAPKQRKESVNFFARLLWSGCLPDEHEERFETLLRKEAAEKQGQGSLMFLRERVELQAWKQFPKSGDQYFRHLLQKQFFHGLSRRETAELHSKLMFPDDDDYRKLAIEELRTMWGLENQTRK